MKTITGIEAMRAAARAERSRGRSIGLVPTMGALHEGHLSLVRASRSEANATIVSIFVNPIQFGPREDYSSYPRDFERDAVLLAAEGADGVFFPDAGEMYPPGFRTTVAVEGLEDKLCGRSRPGHFRGVCTVVLKLFQIVHPDVAFFGQKDAQQALILKRMALDLNLEVRLAVRPIVREADGLALSSRNRYLKPEERRAAVVLSRSLEEARAAIARGERSSAGLLAGIKASIGAEPLARLDYAEIVDPETLEPVPEAAGGTLLALAVFIGRTRLIDNLIVPGKE